ncbi:MAG: glycine/betaine ABC transporter substrate-binding protein, partial [Defluviitaleaceae bacterium]|nr:glycine/betaine ABC transporter substrate-binding protein [Defluviitaleaceae bacterium]
MDIKIGRLAFTCLLAALVSVFFFSSCNRKEYEIRIGSKDFTESIVVAEIYAQALEAAGLKVLRVPAMPSDSIHDAIVSGEIDLYPEYTGTGLLSVLQLDLLTVPLEVYELVKREYDARFDIAWLDFSTANDGQGLVIRTQVAEKYGIRTISDL